MKMNPEKQLRHLAQKIVDRDKYSDLMEIRALARELYDNLTVLIYLQEEEDREENHKMENAAKKPQKELVPLEVHEEEEIHHAVGSKSFDKHFEEQDPMPVERATYNENLAEPLIEKIKDIVAQMPKESHKIDDLLEELLPQKKQAQNDLEDFAASYQQMPTFERKDEKQAFPKSADPAVSKKTETNDLVKDPGKPKSLNQRLNNSLTIGLNDRLAFIKHLFNGNAEEYHRVVSQLTTMDNYEEAQNFLHTIVKPDYNNWEGKEIYSDRFLSILQKRFD